jgi:hypothetical protein
MTAGAVLESCRSRGRPVRSLLAVALVALTASRAAQAETQRAEEPESFFLLALGSGAMLARAHPADTARAAFAVSISAHGTLAEALGAILSFDFASLPPRDPTGVAARESNLGVLGFSPSLSGKHRQLGGFLAGGGGLVYDDERWRGGGGVERARRLEAVAIASAGLRWHVFERGALQLSSRYVRSVQDDSYELWAATAGLVFSLR